MRRLYKCNCCGEKALERKVYTEIRCLSCGAIEHEPHRSRRKKRS